MGSQSGYVDLEVSASTSNGAKEQMQRIYGAEQIINLREIHSRGGNSSSSSDSGGIFALVVVMGAIYLLVNFWPIFLGLGILYVIYLIFS